MLVERNIQYLWPEEYEALSRAFLPNVVLKLRLRGTIHYIDFGSILYQKHTKVDRKTHAVSVIEKTIITELIEPLQEYLLHMVKAYSHASIQHYFKIIRDISKDLYSDTTELEIYNKNSAFKIYQDYTQHLIMTRASKLKDSIADMGAYNRKQTVLAEILSRSLCIDLKEIKNSYIEIASKHKQHNQPANEKSFSQFFEINKIIFQSFIDILYTNKKLPLSIEFNSKNYDINYFFRNDQTKNIVNSKRHIVKMINITCAAFVNCFALATSINFAQIYTLTINDIKNLDSTTKGMRITTTKPRAGYKKIELTIPLKFKPLLQEYLEFKEWVTEFLLESEAFDLDLLFFGLNNPKSLDISSLPIGYTENQHNLYRKWFKEIFHDLEWIPLSKIRATIANIYHNESKNLNIVAKKLGNSPKIISSSYSEATEQQVLSEMSDTFQSIAVSAPIIVNRSKNLKLDLLNALDTDMGHCSSKKPSLDTIYDDLDLEPPNCSNPISCLFCENFVIHSDQEDIHKLLSAKKVFEMANSASNTENIYLVIQKINEILDLIIINDPKKQQVIRLGSEFINKGVLSPFFEIMQNTLTDLGIDFYE